MIIRCARVEDAAAIAEVHVETWRTTYAGMLPDDFLLNLSEEKYEASWWRHVLAGTNSRHYVYVADDEDAGVVGFCSGGRIREVRLSSSMQRFMRCIFLIVFRGWELESRYGQLGGKKIRELGYG